MSEYTPSDKAVEAAMNAHTEEANRFKPNELRPILAPRPTAFYAALAAAVPIELAELLADAWDEGYSHREWHLVRNRVPNPYRTTEGEKS